jgi:hypothetical protein
MEMNNINSKGRRSRNGVYFGSRQKEMTMKLNWNKQATAEEGNTKRPSEGTNLVDFIAIYPIMRNKP